MVTAIFHFYEELNDLLQKKTDKAEVQRHYAGKVIGSEFFDGTQGWLVYGYLNKKLPIPTHRPMIKLC